MPYIKLSSVPKMVIKKMRKGWELGTKSELRGRSTWIQKNGIGKGGQSIKVTSTFYSLCDKNLIQQSERYSGLTEIWELTDLGKTIQL